MATLRKPLLTTSTWPLFSLLFCCFAAAILGDSTAEALLLAHFGSKFIPALFLINAAFLFVFSTAIMSVIDRTDRGNLFIGFLLVHACVLLLVRSAVASNLFFLFPILFSYAYVTKILLFLMFWTLANDLVDSHRAGTDFPLIAAGGTLGAIAISFSIPNLLRIIAPENLLIVWACGLVVTCLLFLPIRQSFGVSFRPAADRYKRVGVRLASIAEDLKLVRTDPLLSSIALLYFLLFFIILNQHFAFYSQLKLRFQESHQQARDLARFLGYFNGTSMFLTFALQATVSGRIIRTIGSTRSLFILPTVLFLVFAALTVMGITGNGLTGGGIASALLFWGVTLGMGARIAFFDSFFSPNFQVFFSSLPQSIRGRGKLSMEGVIKPLAMVSASLWLFLVAPRLPFALNMGILAALAAVMIVQTLRLKKRYTESLAHYLRGFKSKNTQLLRTISHSSKETLFFELVESLLKKESPSVKAYVIDMLALMNSKETISVLVGQLADADAKTRATIVSALGSTRSRDLKQVFLDRLADSDERVVANCIEALGGYRDQDIYERVRGFLNHRNARIGANAVAALWPYARESERAELMLILRHMLTMDSSLYAASALHAMGQIRFPEMVGELRKFYRDQPGRVLENRTVWQQYVLALGKSGRPEAVDVLLDISGVASRKQRNHICISLGMLVNRGVPVPDLIARLPGVDHMQRSVLLKTLYVRPFERRKETMRTLQAVAHQEVKEIYGHWLACASLTGVAQQQGISLLHYAIVEECINENLRNLFYAASMLDTSGQVRRIVHRLFHSNKHVRGQALEVLDNTGDFKTNRMVMKLLESNDPETHAREAVATYRLKPSSYFAVVNDYTHSPNSWVRECATYATKSIFGATQPV